MHDRLIGWRERLRELADRAGSQQALADKAGVSLRSLSRWVNGAASPSVEDAVAICCHAGVSITWLLFGDAASAPPPLDEDLLAEIVEMIEIEAERRGERPAPVKYAGLVVLIYNEEMRHAAAERRADAGTVRRAFRLVS